MTSCASRCGLRVFRWLTWPSAGSAAPRRGSEATAGSDAGRLAGITALELNTNGFTIRSPGVRLPAIDPAIKRSGLAVSRKQGQAWCSRLGGAAADVKVELNGQAGVADGVRLAKGFGFDALVEGAQVGGLAGGDGDDDFGGGGVTDDPGPGGVHAMVGADFPDEGTGERARPQNGGPLVGGDGDGNVAGRSVEMSRATIQRSATRVITRQSPAAGTTPSRGGRCNC